MGSPHVPFQIPNIQSQLENLNVRSNSPALKDYAEEINFITYTVVGPQQRTIYRKRLTR